MCKWFKQMSCYILAGGKDNPKDDFLKIGDVTRLEKSFRSYAAVFDQVKLVIKKDQAREKYLNYPHICDEMDQSDSGVGVTAALRDADSEAVFIAASDINDFPLTLLVKLIKNYNGESFMGYVDKTDKHQPLFGIYHKNIVEKLNNKLSLKSLADLPKKDIKLLELPESVSSTCIGL